MRKTNKIVMSLMVLVTMFVVLPINSKAINIAKVKSSTSNLSESNGFYYINFNEASDNKTYGQKNFSNKYVDYDLGDGYTLRLTLVFAKIYNKVYTSTYLYSNGRTDLDGCIDNIPKSICNTIADDDYGRLIAIPTDSVSVHMYGIRQLKIKYTLYKNGRKMNNAAIKETFGELNARLTDIDHQQAIKIHSNYTLVEKDSNFYKNKKYNINGSPKFSVDEDKMVSATDFFQSKVNACPQTGCTGYIQFKTDENDIELSFLSGKEVWQTSGSGYKYGHAFYRFVTEEIDTDNKKIKITKKAYDYNGNSYSSGSIPNFTFNLYKLKTDGNTVLKGPYTITTNNKGSASFTLSGDWKCAKNGCVYKIVEELPDGWQTQDGTSSSYAWKFDGKNKTVTFTNKQKSNCDLELNSIFGTSNLSIIPLSGTGAQSLSNTKIWQLINLYKKYGFDMLLNYDNKSINTDKYGVVSGLSCSNSYEAVVGEGNPSCEPNLKTRFNKSVNGTISNIIKYGSSALKEFIIDTGKSNIRRAYAYCYINSPLEFSSDIIESNKVVNAGMKVFGSEKSDKIINGNLGLSCIGYFPLKENDGTNFGGAVLKSNQVNEFNTKLKNAVDGYINDLIGKLSNMEYIVNVSGKEYKMPATVETPVKSGPFTTNTDSVLDNNAETTEFWWYNVNIPISFSYGEELKYKKGTGALKNDKSNTLTGGYGFATPIDEYLNGELATFTLSNIPDDLKNYYGVSGSLINECSYSTYCELIDCPGSDDGCDDDDGCKKTKELNLEFRIIDTENPFPSITGDGRTTGSNWKGKTKKYITDRNNSYNAKKAEPLISVTLTFDGMTKIRSKDKGYNYGKEYNDSSLKDEGTRGFQSEFVSNLLNGKYGTVTGSCERDEYRSYCVGGG